MDIVNTDSTLALGLGFALQPLAAALEVEGGLRDFLEERGWSFTEVPPTLSALQGPVLAAYRAAEAVADGEAPDLGALLDKLLVAYRAIRALAQDSSLPPDFSAAFPRELLDYLLAEYLLDDSPALGHLLLMLGVIGMEQRPAAGGRPPYPHYSFAFEAIPELLRHPLATLADLNRWGDAQFASSRLLAGAAGLLEGLGLEVNHGAPPWSVCAKLIGAAAQSEDYEPEALCATLIEDALHPERLRAGLRLLALPGDAANLPGLAILPFASAGLWDATTLRQTVWVSDRLSLGLRAGGNPSAGIALVLRPQQPIALLVDLAADAPSASMAEVEIGLRLEKPGEPFVLLGSAEGSRLELAGVSTRLGARVAADGGLDAYIELRLEQGRILVQPESGLLDGFLAELIPDGGFEASASATVGLSWARGLYLDGSTDLSTDIPVNVSAGPVEIHSARLAVRPAGQEIRVAFGTGFSARIGDIVTARVDRFGVEAVLGLRPGLDGNLGPLDYRLDLDLPDSIGLTVDAAGAVSGGGLLYRDPDRHLYAGVLQLSLQDRLTLKAVGMIATRLPDGARGYSLLVFITAEGFQPIPLGMGFTLQGIGGLLAINRTFDADALRRSLAEGGLAQLLFPPNPAGNPQAIVQAISSAFPARLGSHLLGLMARIGWFSPTLVTLDLALIQELGARRRLLALGRIQARLPSEENDLVRLGVDAVGVLDFDEGHAALDAVLTDSRLCQRFPITGEAAVRARFGSASDAHFVLAVGGLHPRFVPPGDFPPLKRAAIAICAGDNPRLVCQAYFAITSNTLQFGAQADLYVGVGSFSLTGAIGFDVLVQLVPLHFVADYRARLQLKRGRHNLFGVELAGELEGPRPLRIGGRATFKILWFHYSVRFDTTLVDGEAPPLPAASDPTARLIEALSAASALQAIAPPGRPHGVSLRRAPGGTGLPQLDPLGQLAVQQQVLPLNTAQDLDLLDGAPIAGARRFAISADLNGARLAAEPLETPFAPAQYFRMSDDERLAAPAYEPMQAGCRFGSTDADFDAGHLLGVPIAHRPITLGPAPAGASAVPAAATAAALTGQSPALPGAPRGLARGPGGDRLHRRGLKAPRAGESPAGTGGEPRQWVLVPLDLGGSVEPRPVPRTWSDCHAALRQLNREGTRWQMVRAHELESGGVQ